MATPSSPPHVTGRRTGPGRDPGPHLHPRPPGPVRVAQPADHLRPRMAARRLLRGRVLLGRGVRRAGHRAARPRHLRSAHRPRACRGTAAWLICWPKPTRRPPGSRPWWSKTSSGSARDTYNSLKLERQLADQGIPLFATDEPPILPGSARPPSWSGGSSRASPESFRLQLKEKTWKGLKEHTAEGWNLGPVPYGYLPDRVPHPNPFKASQGRTKTRLILDLTGFPLWRRSTPGDRRQAGRQRDRGPAERRPGRLPPGGPGHRVESRRRVRDPGEPEVHRVSGFGRRRRGRPVPVEQWHWSPVPAHPQIIDRATWDAAQATGAEHGSTRDGDDPNTSSRRRRPTRRGPGPVQAVPAADVRHHPHPPRPRTPRRLRLLHLPVQPRQPPARRRRPRSSPHRRRPPGPAAGHPAGRAEPPTRWPPAAPPGSPNSSPPEPPTQRPGTTPRPTRSGSGSSRSTPPNTTSSPN